MSTGAGHLGVLLSKITAVVNGMEPIRDPSTKLRHLFRNFLFYCSLLGFNSSYAGLWPEDWYAFYYFLLYVFRYMLAKLLINE
jgi:hypothetical protein